MATFTSNKLLIYARHKTKQIKDRTNLQLLATTFKDQIQIYLD